jgi:formate-dependent nitrite reductase membrane component NrfD
MLLDRFNSMHWDWLVYLEMFVAGIAAGAYMVAALLEWSGRGRTPLARSAHAIAFPLVAIAGLLLAVDLTRPERFWHMVVQSKTMLPMLKYWSPMSLGAVLLLAFGGITFVSFVDFLISRGVFSLGGWRDERTLHGSVLGRVWSLLGLLAAFGLGSYSGILLSTTNIPGWGDSTLAGALYIATSIVTGAAALVLVQTIRGLIDEDVVALAGTNTWLIVWWLVMLVAFLATLGEGLRFIVTGMAAVALIAAVILAGVVPLALGFGRGVRSRGLLLPSASVLVGGLLIRMAIVVGPQSVH